MRLVYIASPSYSGSTLLTFLLGTHPAVATVGELKATGIGDPEEYECSCGVTMVRCTLWGSVVKELAREGVGLDLGRLETHFRCPAHPIVDRVLRAGIRVPALERVRSALLRRWPVATREYGRIIERNRQLIEVICGLERASVFVDSSKEAIRLKYLVQAGLWDVRTIYLIRDGRGTAASYMRHTGRSMEVSALQWRRAIEEFDRLMKGLSPESWMPLSYETMCSQPDRSLEAVFRFIGLDPAGATKDFRSVEQHILGNVMRLGSSSEITLDERWRTALGPRDLARFEGVAGAVNRRHGYGN